LFRIPEEKLTKLYFVDLGRT